MCIAIYKPTGTRLYEETLSECWNRNPDGAGFMYNEENKLHVVKGLMTYKDFLQAYTPHELKNCVLHFRIKTHGNKDQENTHPFLIDDRLGMVHNGIMNNVDTTEDNTKSDTWHFAKRHVLTFRKNNHNFFTNPVYKAMIESFIGYSKLIFMDNKGKVEIFNEKAGEWNSDCWFSNTSYKPWGQKNSYKPPYKHEYTGKKPQYNQAQLPTPRSCPVIEITSVKKSSSNPIAGDICKTEATVVGLYQNGQEGTIPMGSYVKILYFTTAFWLGVQEVLTGIKAEIHVNQVQLVMPRIKPGDLYDKTDQDLSLSAWE